MTQPLEALLAEIGHDFEDPALFEQALTHASWSHENGGEDYERHEFLGDAVLQMLSTVLLVQRFPDAREGQLSRLRSRLVSTQALARLGRQLGVGPALRLGVGEEATGGRERARVLAGATEAVLGAVFIDGGHEAAQALVLRWLQAPLDALEREAKSGWKDPRSLLQEYTQRELGHAPKYDVAACRGPAHEPTFVVEVRVGERLLGRGEGHSKREASKRAAVAALDSVSA